MEPLSPAQIKRITKRGTREAQRAELRHLGIPFKDRSDGTLLVLAEHVDAAVLGSASAKLSKTEEPDWSAV